MSDLEDELASRIGTINDAHGIAEQVSYNIWGAAVTATRAFDKVVIKIEPKVNRIFVAISLRWWARHKKAAPLHRAWLSRAEKRCLEQIPAGWKLLVFYEKDSIR